MQVGGWLVHEVVVWFVQQYEVVWLAARVVFGMVVVAEVQVGLRVWIGRVLSVILGVGYVVGVVRVPESVGVRGVVW